MSSEKTNPPMGPPLVWSFAFATVPAASTKAFTSGLFRSLSSTEALQLSHTACFSFTDLKLQLPQAWQHTLPLSLHRAVDAFQGPGNSAWHGFLFYSPRLPLARLSPGRSAGCLKLHLGVGAWHTASFL